MSVHIKRDPRGLHRPAGSMSHAALHTLDALHADYRDTGATGRVVDGALMVLRDIRAGSSRGDLPASRQACGRSPGALRGVTVNPRSRGAPRTPKHVHTRSPAGHHLGRRAVTRRDAAERTMPSRLRSRDRVGGWPACRRGAADRGEHPPRRPCRRATVAGCRWRLPGAISSTPTTCSTLIREEAWFDARVEASGIELDELIACVDDGAMKAWHHLVDRI